MLCSLILKQETNSMKSAFTLLLLCLAAAAAHAQTTSGGFSGPDGRQIVTVAEVDGLADETEIRLVGFIVRKTGDEKYEFKDDSGALIVEIDDDEWRGIEVSPSNKVELTGEVDRERTRTEVEVDSVKLVQ
jgi:uncharacterized protein (TIGR00156 family)